MTADRVQHRLKRQYSKLSLSVAVTGALILVGACVFGLDDLISGNYKLVALYFLISHDKWEDSCSLVRTFHWLFAGSVRRGPVFGPGDVVRLAATRELVRIIRRPLVTRTDAPKELKILRFSAHPSAWTVESCSTGERMIFTEDSLRECSPLEQLADQA